MDSGPLVQANAPIIREMQPLPADLGKARRPARLPVSFFLRNRRWANTFAS